MRAGGLTELARTTKSEGSSSRACSPKHIPDCEISAAAVFAVVPSPPHGMTSISPWKSTADRVHQRMCCKRNGCEAGAPPGQGDAPKKLPGTVPPAMISCPGLNHCARPLRCETENNGRKREGLRVFGVIKARCSSWHLQPAPSHHRGRHTEHPLRGSAQDRLHARRSTCLHPLSCERVSGSESESERNTRGCMTQHRR